MCLEPNARGSPLHYVVVAGVDPIQNLVLVNDPAQRKLLSISRTEFERGWRATENWALLAVPEVDLASTAFRDEKLSEAREHLTSALRANPSDSGTNEFLATVYFLQNNTEAALKYWNRAGKPVIENIRIDPPLRTDPVLLDRALAFSRGSFLSLEDFQTSQARLNALRVFSRYQMELSSAGGERFDVTLRAAERAGMNLVSWFRGLPFATINPEFSNIRGKAINVESLLRWDSNKRRASISVSAPLKSNPKWGVGINIDARRENWADAGGDFEMRFRNEKNASVGRDPLDAQRPMGLDEWGRDLQPVIFKSASRWCGTEIFRFDHPESAARFCPAAERGFGRRRRGWKTLCCKSPPFREGHKSCFIPLARNNV